MADLEDNFSISKAHEFFEKTRLVSSKLIMLKVAGGKEQVFTVREVYCTT